MSNPVLRDYEATYRRSELALPLVVGIAIVGGSVVTAVIVWTAGDQGFEGRVLSAAGVLVLALLSVFLVIFRRHRWTLKQDGIVIEERPKVPLTGLPHRTFVTYGDIVAFCEVESGFDHLIENVARNGRRYRMVQRMVQKKGEKFMRPDANALLGDLKTSIRDAAANAGVKLPATTQALSFWNTIPGLAFLGFLFAVSLAICGGVVLALFEGFTTSQPRGGEALAILLLLPVGAFILLRKMLKRRWKVLETLRQAVPANPVRR
jgi:hypothetical protein